MSLYNIHMFNIPNHKDVLINYDVLLTKDMLLGFIIMLKANFDKEFDEYCIIYDKSVRAINLDKLIDDNNVIISDGELAFDLDPTYDQTWTEDILEISDMYGEYPNITKRYTTVLHGIYNFYLLQFDSLEFLNGFKLVCRLLNNTEFYFDIKYIYDGDKQLEIIYPDNIDF